MELYETNDKIFTFRRSIRWSGAAFFFGVLGITFLFIHSYLHRHAAPTDGLSSSYLSFVLALFIIWFLGIILFLLYLVMKYDPQRNPDSPYLNETLAMPPGVFRAILTVTLLFAVVLLEGYAITNTDKYEQIQKILDPLFSAFQVMIAFYFGTKMVEIISGKGKAEDAPKG